MVEQHFFYSSEARAVAHKRVFLRRCGQRTRKNRPCCEGDLQPWPRIFCPLKVSWVMQHTHFIIIPRFGLYVPVMSCGSPG
ncbi:hypothetical protein HZ326_19934 [Fusarium oxysporum f. sp. albedinis]|nr:hypothetical protein HZ326_19934 [Fusarium oxysporum f. sp. albedinis]